MASCDFSMREYSYNDVEGDFNMSHFALEYEDLHYKLSNRLFYYTDRFWNKLLCWLFYFTNRFLFLQIPIMQAALRMSNGSIRYFSSPWSAPGWMKTTGSYSSGGSLRGFPGGPYYQGIFEQDIFPQAHIFVKYKLFGVLFKHRIISTIRIYELVWKCLVRKCPIINIRRGQLILSSK